MNLQALHDQYKQNLAVTQTYLCKRGISLETATRFELGFGKMVTCHMSRLFHNRLVFPIWNGDDGLVAFGGRRLDQREPKYINSPESSTFRKRECLYGLKQARASIQDSKQVILVEGFLDTLKMHQMGYTNTVAIMGSHVSQAQSTLLKQLGVTGIVLAFDGDQAGLEATWRYTEHNPHSTASCAMLKSGIDPATISPKQMAATLEQIISHKLHYFNTNPKADDLKLLALL
jgi:DNA primase